MGGSKPRDVKRERKRDADLLLLARAYADRAQRGHADAAQQVDDLAFHQPELFWRFLELAVDSDIPLADLDDIGWGPLTWLLRRCPDDWGARVAGLAKRNTRMMALAKGVDRDRVAPDIARLLDDAAS